jgi:type I restriction enzyme S subunit
MIDGWDKSALGNISQVISGSTPKTNIKEYWNNGYINWITPNDLSKLRNRHINNTERKITKNGLESCSTILIKKESLVMSSRAPIGYIAISNNFCTNQGCKSFVFKDKNSTSFFYYQLLSNVAKLKQIGEGTTFAEVSKKQLEAFIVLHPKDIKEQQKIAKILTTVDDSIESTNKIIAKQKRVKTALMQDLLTYGIDEDGNIRSEATYKFKDSPLGRIPEEWEVLQLKSLCNDFIVPMRDKPKEFIGDIPWCRIEDFDGKFLSKTKSNQYVDKNTIKKMNLKIHPIDTVLCSCSAVIGKTTIVKKPLITNQTFIGLVPNKRVLNSEFLYYLLPTYIQRLENLSSGTTIVYLSREKFETFEIIAPTEIEQEKISKILSKQDEAIEQEEQKLKKLQSIKKALMQDLLTGKVRVNYE